MTVIKNHLWSAICGIGFGWSVNAKSSIVTNILQLVYKFLKPSLFSSQNNSDEVKPWCCDDQCAHPNWQWPSVEVQQTFWIGIHHVTCPKLLLMAVWVVCRHIPCLGLSRHAPSISPCCDPCPIQMHWQPKISKWVSGVKWGYPRSLTGSLLILASWTHCSISRCRSSAGRAADRINVANCWSPSFFW